MNRNPDFRKKPVVAYNNRKGFEMHFASVRECARTFGLDVNRISRAARSGAWVFAAGNFRVRYA